MNVRQLKQNKITLLVSAVVLVFGGLLYWMLQPSSESHKDNAKSPQLVEFQGSNLEEKKNGKLVWKLTAEKIMIDPETQIMYFTAPNMVIADVDGQELTITAESGTADRTKKEIVIKPPIQAQTQQGDTLQTDGNIYYNMDTRQIKGGKVLMKRSDNTELSGDSFETDAGLNHVLLKGNAKVTKGE